MQRLIALAAAGAATLAFTACGTNSQPNPQATATKQVHAAQRARGVPYVPRNNVEFNNFNRAQRLYDSPDTIIWCSTTWGNPSSPIVTVPIAGKLTSSTVSVLPPDWVDTKSGSQSDVDRPNISVDGMYHGNPPPYRFGFTPGGQYVDFFNMPTVCTTALTKFQRQQTKLTISIDPTAAQAQKQAEAALARGDSKGAQAALESIGG